MDDWLRHGETAVQQCTMRLLGGNEEFYCQDLHWYLGEGVNIISQVQVEESHRSEVSDPASPISNTVEIETLNIVGFTNLGPEMTPSRQRFTRFRTQGIRLYSGNGETTPNPRNGSDPIEQYDYLAVVSERQLELLLAQDLFSSFMWSAADKMQTLSVESTLHQTGQIQPTDLAWFDSLRLENTALSSIASEIERVGLGRLEDAYASIIPPLSIKHKLPMPDCLVRQAQERAQNLVAHENWQGATDVYSELFGRCIAFGRTSPLAIEATATVYVGLRTARALRCLWERWRPCPIQIRALKKQELELQRVLEKADEQLISNFRIMRKLQQRRANSDKYTSENNGDQNIMTGSGLAELPSDDVIGFAINDNGCLRLTTLHRAVIANNLFEIQHCLLNGQM